MAAKCTYTGYSYPDIIKFNMFLRSQNNEVAAPSDSFVYFMEEFINAL